MQYSPRTWNRPEQPSHSTVPQNPQTEDKRLVRTRQNSAAKMRQCVAYSMTHWLDRCGWTACIVYSTIPSFWLLVHPGAEYWRSRKRSPYVVLLPAWFAMWIVVGLLTSPWRHTLLYATRWTWIPASLLFSTGFWIYAQSGKYFSRA